MTTIATLTLGGTTLILSRAMFWSDEYNWTPTVQATDYSLTGALLAQTAERQAGRPVTLTTPVGGATLSHGTLEALRAWLTEAGPFQLALVDGRTLDVVWRHADGPLEAKSVRPGLSNPDDESLYLVTLRFLEL